MKNVNLKNLYLNPYRRKRRYIEILTDNDEKLIGINLLQKFFKPKFKDDIYNAHSEKIISNNKDEFVLLTKIDKRIFKTNNKR